MFILNSFVGSTRKNVAENVKLAKILETRS